MEGTPMKLARRQFLHLAPPSERESAEKVVLELVEGEPKRLASIRWLLLLFVIVVVLGSLFNVFLGVGVLGFAAGAILDNLRKADNALLLAMSMLTLIFAGFGFSFASKAATATFDLLIPNPSTAAPHAGRLLFHGFLLIILEALLVWLWLSL
jgi:hypothetical protein